MNEDQTESVTPPPDEQSSELEALRREADEQRDRCLRVAAELDNLRKRSAREVESARKFGAERLAQAILPVRDSIEAGAGRGREGWPSGSARRVSEPRCGCSTRRSALAASARSRRSASSSIRTSTRR